METIHKRLQTHTLMIAEDDPSTLKWLVRVLSIYFKEVRGASDAMEALELFNLSPSDIILADIQMPEVDGLSFLQKIATLSPQTLRIVMTAFNSHPYLNRAVEAGVHFYLKKPIDIDELLVAIASNLPNTNLNESITDLGENFTYNTDTKMIYQNKQAIKLTKKEVLLLELFLKNRDSVLSLNQIERTIWEEPATPDAIRMVIVGLRKKLYPTFITNLKGLGYRINLS